MQKRTRNELKKILTGIKDILNIDVKTRDINSTEKIKETVKNIAFQFARENKALTLWQCQRNVILKLK